MTREDLLQSLGLGGYNARILCALVDRSGVPYNTREIASFTGVPRTSVYQCCDQLVKLGLINEFDNKNREWRAYPWEITILSLRTMVAESAAHQQGLLDELAAHEVVG